MPGIEPRQASGWQRLRLALWICAAVLAVALPALVYLRGQPAAPASDPVAIGGRFTLTDAAGKPFASSGLAGRPHAIFFGFTHCPDICPTTLARLARLRRQLGEGDQAFEILFISVDPERDTPQAVGQYAALFDSPVIGLTGTPQQIARVKSLYGVFAEKASQPGGGYSVDHSASVFLFDGDGRFTGTIAPDEGDPAALDKLKRISA